MSRNVEHITRDLDAARAGLAEVETALVTCEAELPDLRTAREVAALAYRAAGEEVARARAVLEDLHGRGIWSSNPEHDAADQRLASALQAYAEAADPARLASAAANDAERRRGFLLSERRRLSQRVQGFGIELGAAEAAATAQVDAAKGYRKRAHVGS